MNAKKLVSAALGAALVAGAAIPAFAAPHQDGKPPHGMHHGPRGPHGPDRPMGPPPAMMKDMMFIRLLKTADTNKDGKISKDEFTTSQDAMFTAVDTNKDGFLTPGEFLDWRIAKMQQFRKDHPRPQDADAKDGKGPQDQADKDQGAKDQGPDGKGPMMGDDHGPSGWMHHGRGPHGGPMGRGGDMARHFFRMADTDHDGKISKAEAAAASDKLFTWMDTNKDGQITIDDLPDRPF